MNTSQHIRSRALLAANCLMILHFATADCPADDAPRSRIGVVSLRDFDLSNEIRNAPRPAETRDLKPRLTPGYEELRHALWMGGRNAVAAHLSVGADPNALSPEGEPVLHYAVGVGELDKLEDVLKASADPNRSDQHHQTPLDRAARQGNRDVVALLLKYGADPNLKRADGTTPRERAKSYATPEIMALLEAAPQKPPPLAPIKPPVVLRRPQSVYGSNKFCVAAGGRALVYTPDSRRLIAGDEEGAIRFFDAQSGDVQDVLNAHQGAVLGLALVPKSRILVSAGEDQTVRFWDIDSFQELKRLKGDWVQGQALAVSPGGRLLNTGAQIWEIESLKPLKLAEKGRELLDANRAGGSCWSIFTPDSRYLLISRGEKGAWAWDVKENAIRRIDNFDPTAAGPIRWKNLAGAIDARPASPSELLAIIVNPYTLFTAPPAQLKEFEKLAHSFSRDARAVACSPNGQYLAALDYERIKVYDVERGDWLPYAGDTQAVLAVAASPDGELIASGGNDMTVRIWRRKSGEELEKLPVDSYVYSVCFSPDGKLLAIGDNSGKVYLWDVEQKSLHSYHASGRITDLAFDPRGEFLVFLGFEVSLFDLKTRAVKAKVTTYDAQQGTIALSHDGKLIAGSARSMAANETYKIPEAWTIDGNELIPNNKDVFSEEMGHRYSIYSVAFSPRGPLLAASSDYAVRLWDMKKRRAIGEEFCGHTYYIGDMKFSPDGKWLATASWDGTARVWEIPSGRQAILIDADVYRVSCVDFTPDGQLATANWDGTVHLWDLASAGKQ